MISIFVYEYLSAIGARGDDKSPLALSLYREGRAMLDAIVADFRAIPEVQVFLSEEEEEAAFRNLAQRADFSLIIAPEFDRLLETRCLWVEEAGGKLLGSSPAAIRLTADKFELSRHWEKENVPSPVTWLLDCEPSHFFPMVLKPRFGAGSQNTFLLQSENDYSAALLNVERESIHAEMIAQAYVVGIAASVAFLIGPNMVVALQPCLQHLSDDGRFHYLGGSLPIPADLAARAISLGQRAIAAIPSLRGYVGVDVIFGTVAANDSVIEINPRLTSSYIGLRQLADFNIAEMMLNVVRGAPIGDLPWKQKLVEFNTIYLCD